MLKQIVYKGKNQLKMSNKIFEINRPQIRRDHQSKIKQNSLVKDSRKTKKFL